MDLAVMTGRTDKEGAGAAKALKILVVEDHAIVREAVCLLLEREPGFKVIGSVATGEDAISFVRRNKPDVIVMDLGLPGMSGLEATRAIKQENSDIRVLILTIYADHHYLLSTLDAGVSGYLLKQSAVNDLIPAVRAISHGSVFLQPSTTQAVVELLRKSRDQFNGISVLSQREKDVLDLVGHGFSSKEIGRKLFLSPRTVDNYRSRILEKLNARNVFEAYNIAIKQGLIEAWPSAVGN